MRIKIKCDYCGKEIYRYPSQVKKHNFCSRACGGMYASKEHNPDGYAEYRDFLINSARMSEMNTRLNPTRMTEETKNKISASRFGGAGGKTKYLKLHGRHIHRIIAEQKIGRPLNPAEVVHHIDGDTHNNSPDNLEVLESQSKHARLHSKRGGGDSMKFIPYDYQQYCIDQIIAKPYIGLFLDMGLG